MMAVLATAACTEKAAVSKKVGRIGRPVLPQKTQHPVHQFRRLAIAKALYREKPAGSLCVEKFNRFQQVGFEYFSC